MFPFCEKSIPHQWECFRNQNYFALSAAAAAGLLLRVCSAGFASAGFASAGRASAGCVPQALLHGHCFCGHCFCELCFCGFVPRVCSAVFPLRRGKCRMQQAVRQAAERGWRRSDGVQEAFRRRSGGVRVQASAVGSVPARRRFSNSRTAGRPSRGSRQSIRCGRCASLLTRISKKRSPRKGS